MQYQMEFSISSVNGEKRKFSKWYDSKEQLALKWLELSTRYAVRAIAVHERMPVVSELDF